MAKKKVCCSFDYEHDSMSMFLSGRPISVKASMACQRW